MKKSSSPRHSEFKSAGSDVLMRSIGTEDDEGSIDMNLSRASSFAIDERGGGSHGFKSDGNQVSKGEATGEQTLAKKKGQEQSFLRKIISWLLTNIVLVQPDDAFEQTLRKMTVTLMIVCTPYILFYIGYWLFIYRGEAALIVQSVNLAIFQVVFTISYILLRRRKHVTDAQQEFQTWTIIIGWVITAIAVPEYDVRGVVYATGLMCSLSGTKSFMWQMIALPQLHDLLLVTCSRTLRSQ